MTPWEALKLKNDGELQKLNAEIVKLQREMDAVRIRTEAINRQVMNLQKQISHDIAKGQDAGMLQSVHASIDMLQKEQCSLQEQMTKLAQRKRDLTVRHATLEMKGRSLMDRIDRESQKQNREVENRVQMEMEDLHRRKP